MAEGESVGDKQQIAALREEIREAGNATDRLRFGIGVFLLLSLVSVLGLGARGPLWLLAGAGCMVLVPLVVALPAASAYREARRRRLRKAIEHLTMAERAELLSPLRRDPARDTQRLAASFAREFGILTELAPAPPPDGRGDEAVGA